jgi:hypothetical protein
MTASIENALLLIAQLREPQPNPMHVNLARYVITGLAALADKPVPENMSPLDMAMVLEGYTTAAVAHETQQLERARQAACN